MIANVVKKISMLKPSSKIKRNRRSSPNIYEYFQDIVIPENTFSLVRAHSDNISKYVRDESNNLSGFIMQSGGLEKSTDRIALVEKLLEKTVENFSCDHVDAIMLDELKQAVSLIYSKCTPSKKLGVRGIPDCPLCFRPTQGLEGLTENPIGNSIFCSNHLRTISGSRNKEHFRSLKKLVKYLKKKRPEDFYYEDCTDPYLIYGWLEEVLPKPVGHWNEIRLESLSWETRRAGVIKVLEDNYPDQTKLLTTLQLNERSSYSNWLSMLFKEMGINKNSEIAFSSLDSKVLKDKEEEYLALKRQVMNHYSYKNIKDLSLKKDKLKSSLRAESLYLIGLVYRYFCFHIYQKEQIQGAGRPKLTEVKDRERLVIKKFHELNDVNINKRGKAIALVTDIPDRSVNHIIKKFNLR